MTETDRATKADLANTEDRLRTEITATEDRVTERVERAEHQLDRRIDEVRSDVRDVREAVERLTERGLRVALGLAALIVAQGLFA